MYIIIIIINIGIDRSVEIHVEFKKISIRFDTHVWDRWAKVGLI